MSGGSTARDGTEGPREPETAHAGSGPAPDADEIVGLCRERLERGERVDVDAICRDHPAIGGVLRERLAVLLLIHDAGAPTTADGAGGAPLVGAAVGPWRLVEELGSGGMGTVFLAESGAVRRAVKVLHPHLLARPGSFKRFLREAEIGRKVRHPNVVATLDADATQVGGRTIHYLVMEYVEGRTLRSLLGELGRVPEELCRHIGREAALALAAVHAAGAVHRDVKPENLLITGDQVVKLMDLGVSREAAGEEALRVSETGAFVGSVRYAAPEQFRSGAAALDGRADLYALGLTLYELATGAHPFPGDDFHTVLRRQLTETPRPAGEVNQQLSPFFEEVLRRLLDKDAEKRVASAAELAEILDAGESSAWWTGRAQAIRDASHRPLRRIRIPRETALYGRGEELTRLRAAFESAKSGEGRVVLLEGEAGIGKSRLADEFVAALRREGEDLDFLFGSYPPGGAATAAGAFTTAYREHFGDDLTALSAALPEQPLLVPAFAALLRGDGPPAGADPLTKDSLQTVFVRATQSLARTRPVVVLIDDLHFAPEEGRALFLSIAHAVPGHRVLLLGTARPGLPDGFLSSISRLDHCARLPLPRLGPKDLSRLLVDAFRSERLAEELAFKIGAKSDGNPWFVFEILRGLREGQFLSRRPDGTWVTTRVIEDIEVPSTVKDLVFGRVGDLATEDRNLLDVAAVAGFEFDAALVGEVVGLGRIPSLQRLAGVEKTHHLVHSAGRRFVFDHHQVAEVLYAALPEPLREEYHAALGDAIERRHGAAAKEPKDVDGAVCVDLAEHFLKGGKGERALRYLDAGLRHLERGNQAESAIRLAGSALSAPGMLDVPQRCDLLRRRAALGAEQGRIADADRDTAASLALAEARGDPVLVARARMSVAYVRLRQSHLDDAEPLLQSALALSREAGDTSNEAACRSNLGGLLGIRGRMAEAVAETERAALLFGSVRDLSGEARSVCNIACFLTTMGRFDEALLVLTRAREIARRAGNRGQEANIDGQTGLVYLNLSRASDGRAALERQLASARELGDRQNEIRATANLGLALEMLGLYADALSSARRSLELSRELGLPGDEAAALLVLGELHAKCGEIVPARRDLDACVVLSRLSHEATFEAAALDRIAELVSEESYEESERFAAEALELRRRIQAAAEAADTLCGRGARRARHGRIEGAVADLDAAIEQARALGLHGVENLALVRRAILPGGDVAAAVEAWRGMTSEVGMSLCLEAELLLWRATCDRAHLVEAKRLLDHLVEHAPPECRGPMLVNVRLHREVAGAARAHGL